MYNRCTKCGSITEKRPLFATYYDHCAHCDRPEAQKPENENPFTVGYVPPKKEPAKPWTAMQVHDEIVVEIHDRLTEEYIERIKKVMEAPYVSLMCRCTYMPLLDEPADPYDKVAAALYGNSRG